MGVLTAELNSDYSDLSRQELLDKAYDLAYNYVKNSHQCSQSTAAAFNQLIGFDNNIIRALTTASGGHVDQVVGTCGALIGGVAVLDYYFGRDVSEMSFNEPVDISPKLRAMEQSVKLYEKFLDKWGATHCSMLTRQIYGRLFWFSDSDDLVKLGEAKDRVAPKSCWDVVGNAARWTLEILLDNDIVKGAPEK
jgi:C_GCAxxG_C_C family probable redox protein